MHQLILLTDYIVSEKSFFINDQFLFYCSMENILTHRLVVRKGPLGNLFLKFWHLWCIITMVMMQIKFNSLFYKLADAVWQRKTASLRWGPWGSGWAALLCGIGSLVFYEVFC